MNATCPHCQQDIEIIGTTDITRDFDLTPNMIQHAINRGRFPDPWIKFNNRSLWLRSAIESYQEDRTREKSVVATRLLKDALARLSEDDRAKIIEELSAPKGGPVRRRRAA